jgi:hypothetical protein
LMCKLNQIYRLIIFNLKSNPFLILNWVLSKGEFR